MGPVEETSKIASGFMIALKDQPLSLALVVMNMALLILVFYTANAEKSSRKYMAELILKQHSETELLLSKCIDVDSIQKMLENK
jgi:hypothetical protein